MEQSKEEKLKEIENILKNYDGKMEISPYVLKYLSLDELDTILLTLLKQQSNVIEENRKWLERFKKEGK